jgi:hypothetical protein
MCRNIKTLYNFDPPASEDEVSAAALAEVTEVSTRLLDHLVTAAPPKDREVEAAKRRARSEARFAA